ncbi:MAG: ferrochelatase [Verrucomicrobiales bacterium]|nr:ferrochelatase [Verrucomicrobiales bacterium]
MSKQGILLVNLGSPDSTDVGDVRRYLRQFLMDGKVLDAPYPIRFCVVHFAILPSRPKESAEAYKKIWQPEGSPLVISSRAIRDEMEKRFPDAVVELAMRYQNPSIESAIGKLKEQGVTDLAVVPLFPHYAMSSYESAVERVKVVAKKMAPQMALEVVPPYYDDEDYIEALVDCSADLLSQGYDHLLFSFHGIPERHLHKSDPDGGHLEIPEGYCCDEGDASFSMCYRAQCFKTMDAFVKKAGIPKDKYSHSFQSRLGREPWLKPYTDHVIDEMPGKGIKKLLVICPVFISDCLETIEEIGMRGKEDFIKAGGDSLDLIPCLNEHPRWLDALQTITQRHLKQ